MAKAAASVPTAAPRRATATRLLLLAAVTLGVAAATFGATAAHAVQVGGEECPATDPIASIDFSAAPYDACVQTRCKTTIDMDVATVPADGQCDAAGTEKTSTLSCDEFLAAYSAFYACVLRGMGADTAADPAIATAMTLYENTPGAPMSITPFMCYSCVNFNAAFAPTALPDSCSSSNTCEKCCGQSPLVDWPLQPGRGYNHVLCGSGCVTALEMTAFILLSAFIFGACGCCWPTPSLKTTVERLEREEEEAKARAAAQLSSDEDRGRHDDEDDDPHAGHHFRPSDTQPRSNQAASNDGEYPTEEAAAPAEEDVVVQDSPNEY